MSGNMEYGSAAVEPPDVWEEIEPHIDPEYTAYEKKTRAALEGTAEEPERWSLEWVGTFGGLHQYDLLNAEGDTMATIQLNYDDEMRHILSLLTHAPELADTLKALYSVFSGDTEGDAYRQAGAVLAKIVP